MLGPVYYYSSTSTKITRITGCVKNTAVQSLSSPATALGSGPRLSRSSGSPRRPDCLIRGSGFPISLPFAILDPFLANTRHCGRGHLFTRHRNTARILQSTLTLTARTARRCRHQLAIHALTRVLHARLPPGCGQSDAQPPRELRCPATAAAPHAAAVWLPLAVLISGWLRYYHYFSARHSTLLCPRQIGPTRSAPLHQLTTTPSPTLFDVLLIHSSSAYSRGPQPPKCP